MENSEIRKINIKNVSGECKSLEVKKDILVSELKSEISQIFNAPIDRQRLIHQAKLLKDNQPLSDYVKEDGLTVHLMVRSLDSEASQLNQPPQSFENISIPISFIEIPDIATIANSSLINNPQPNSQSQNPFSFMSNFSIENLINVITQQIPPPFNANEQLISEMARMYNLILDHNNLIREYMNQLARIIRAQQEQQFASPASQVNNANIDLAFRDFQKNIIEGASAFVENLRTPQEAPPRPLSGTSGFLSSVCSFILGEAYDEPIAELLDIDQEDFEADSPLFTVFWSLSLRQIIESFLGVGNALNRLISSAKQEILIEILEDTPENRQNLANDIFNVSHNIEIPQNFISRIKPEFDFTKKFGDNFVFWGKREIDFILDYQGQNELAGFKDNIMLFQGNLLDIIKDALNGDLDGAKDMMVEMIMNRIGGAGGGLAMSMLS